MKFSIGQKVYLGFGVALLILVVISIVSYRSAIKSIETARWVEHTHTVLVSLEHLLLVAKDAESGVRGYVITGNASYLEPYQTATQEIDQKVMDLRRLTSDNPHQQRRLDALEPLIAERVAFSRETVDILKNRGIEEAIRVVQTGRGKRLMDGIRRGILEMEDEERTLLKQRLEEAEGSVRQTLAVIASGGLLAFALVALSVLIIHREIAERMRTEEGLRQQALTFQNMHDSVVITDLERRVMDWNPAAERMFGYSRQEALGKPVEVLQKPEEATALTAKITEEIRREGRWSGEITFVRKDGTEGVSETVIVPLLDRQGRLIATIGVNRDITRRKQAEIELQKAKEAAEAASRAKSEFLANMSHEIRTPMNGVIGMTELMLDTALTPAQRSYLEMVKSSAYALLNVINDVLDFSKIEAGKLDLEPIDFNLRDSLGDTMRPLALRAHQKGLELIYHVHADVPDALTGDAGRLQQILITLVGNAIKFTEKGEVVVVVEKQGSGVRGQGSETSETEKRRNGETEQKTFADSPIPRFPDSCFLRFSVRDTGIGIPKDKQQAIFQAFEQADRSTTRTYGGTGLGLAISSQLVRMMGGQIGVESQVGRGSVFHFTAPFEMPEAPAARPAPALPVSIQGLPALIVDDNATNRYIFEEILMNWGMKPRAVENGREALESLERAREAGTPFAVALLDFHMPEMDGLALAERIKQRPDLSDTAVIMLSSASHIGDAANRRNLGIRASLLKPVKQSELLEVIQSVLSASPTAASPAPQTAPQATRPLRILLVEDNPVNQVLATHLLRNRRHAVVVAGNGREALAALARERFDLALMDVQMPEMDGFAATAAIREQERAVGGHLPIIAMTAYAMKGDRERCLDAGMDGYVSKPIRPEELFRVIEELAEAPAGEDAPKGEEEREDTLDRETLLERVGGDKKLLKDIIAMFLEDCPKRLAKVREAIARRGGEALERAAHALKGGVGNFSVGPAFEAAQRLEQMGEQENLAGVEEVYAALEREMERLTQALIGLKDEDT